MDNKLSSDYDYEITIIWKLNNDSKFNTHENIQSMAVRRIDNREQITKKYEIAQISRMQVCDLH